jgi:hypothetical protein
MGSGFSGKGLSSNLGTARFLRLTNIQRDAPMKMATTRTAASIPTPILIPLLPPAASLIIGSDGTGVIDTGGTAGLIEGPTELDEADDVPADTAEGVVVVTDELGLEVAFKENVRAFTSNCDVKVTPAGLFSPSCPG